MRKTTSCVPALAVIAVCAIAGCESSSTASGTGTVTVSPTASPATHSASPAAYRSRAAVHTSKPAVHTRQPAVHTSTSAAVTAYGAAAATASASPAKGPAALSPHWTQITAFTGLGFTSAGLLRTGDGRLHVVWPSRDAGGDSLRYSTVGGHAKLVATGTILRHWASIDQSPGWSRLRTASPSRA